MAEPITSPEDPIIQPTMDLKRQDRIPTINRIQFLLSDSVSLLRERASSCKDLKIFMKHDEAGHISLTDAHRDTLMADTKERIGRLKAHVLELETLFP